jgi:hypothetical protein
MTPSGVELIGFSFVLKIFASWGLITMSVSALVTMWQKLMPAGQGPLTSRQDPWQQARQNRRAAIIRSYQEPIGEQAPPKA